MKKVLCDGKGITSWKQLEYHKTKEVVSQDVVVRLIDWVARVAMSSMQCIVLHAEAAVY